MLVMQKIRSIARIVRKKCEAFAKSEASKNCDFHNQEDLSCMCAVASFVLAEALRENGLECNVVHGNFYLNGCYRSEHCWVEVKNKIVDITATQFKSSIPKVYIISNKNPQFVDKEIKNDYLSFHNWAGQMPSPKVTEKILKIT
jgi:hypothetical protein